MAVIIFLQALCLALAPCLSTPVPGRVPKVYNALITSNQNLEPSKAYPVYQPVLHDFSFPYQPVFYSGGQFPSLFPPKEVGVPQPPAPSQPGPDSPPQAPSELTPSEAKPDSPAQPETPPEGPKGEASNPTGTPPLPPQTESPIPLNEFGLPPQVLPLNRFNPNYEGFTHVGSPFTYSYPGFRFYDPYDPFGYNSYINYSPLYRPLPNSLGSGFGQPPAFGPNAVNPNPPQDKPSSPSPVPPSEPDNLNVLNYSSKDPTIPNVPPPPLPEGGLKADSE